MHYVSCPVEKRVRGAMNFQSYLKQVKSEIVETNVDELSRKKPAKLIAQLRQGLVLGQGKSCTHAVRLYRNTTYYVVHNYPSKDEEFSRE